MSHVSRELFAALVWLDLAVVTAVFLYLVSALRDAGGFRFDLDDVDQVAGRDEEGTDGDGADRSDL